VNSVEKLPYAVSASKKKSWKQTLQHKVKFLVAPIKTWYPEWIPGTGGFADKCTPTHDLNA
jgi:hypothetical protein